MGVSADPHEVLAKKKLVRWPESSHRTRTRTETAGTSAKRLGEYFRHRVNSLSYCYRGGRSESVLEEGPMEVEPKMEYT
jgi:hypothetical protein